MVSSRLFLAVAACFGLGVTLPSPAIVHENGQLVSRGDGGLDFAAFCWDTTTWANKTERATLADILAVADVVEQQQECAIKKSRGGSWKIKKGLGTSGSAKVNLLFTEEQINKDVFLVDYSCYLLATRIRNIAQSCAMLLDTNYLMIWSILGVCDGTVMDSNPVTLPRIGQSGVAIDISASAAGLIPDMGESRRGKPFFRLNVTTKETEAPIPGFEAYKQTTLKY